MADQDGLGARLRLSRKAMSQGELARRLGVDKNSVGRYERGERVPDASYLEAFAALTEVSIDWLVTGDQSDLAAGLIHRIRVLMGNDSARAFAEAAGIADSTLRSVLSGTRPQVDTLVAIAEAGGVSLDWLVQGDGETAPSRAERSAAAFRSRLGQIVGSQDPFAWAKNAGIPSSTWDRVWNHGLIPKAATLVKIAEASGQTVDWLIKGPPPQARRSPSGNPGPLIRAAVQAVLEEDPERTLGPDALATLVTTLIEAAVESAAPGEDPTISRQSAKAAVRLMRRRPGRKVKSDG